MEERSKTFADLIPELKLWNHGQGIDIDAWIACIGNFEQAIGYSRLFWPDFVEHDGCVLAAGFSEESYRGFMAQTGGNKRAVESVMNHRHIVDLFGDPKLRPTREQVVYLGRILKDLWSAKLRRDFPTRSITVSFREGEYEDLTDYEITFFQDQLSNREHR